MGFLDDMVKKAGEEQAAGGVENVVELSPEERTRALSTAEGQMVEELTEEMEHVLQDVLLPSESIIYKIRSSATGDRSQLALTNMTLIIINKGLFGGQGQDTGGGLLGVIMGRARISVRVYPLTEIRSFEFQPLKGITVGHFQVLTNATSERDNESKFLFDNHIGYFKALHVYRKIRQLRDSTAASV